MMTGDRDEMVEAIKRQIVRRDTIPFEAIERVVRYLENAERDDYEESDVARRAKHIYRAVLQVREWLNEQKARARGTVLDAG